MSHKKRNIDKEKTPRKTWNGYYQRKTKTRREKELNIEKKYGARHDE